MTTFTTTDPVASPKDILNLAATDGEFFARTFFPKTMRQPSAPFHREIWDLMDDPTHNRVALKVFRGGAKTTLLRLFVAKRIAYAVSRTIVFTSASQGHAIKSIMWLRNNIEANPAFSTFFKLKPGRKWTDEWIVIEHALYGTQINVLAIGITGQSRGINIDDYRPDLIVVDDACDEENTSSEIQLEKTHERILSSLENSLAPQSECPDAKIVLLQTPFVANDIIEHACASPYWASRSYSCFDSDGESRWPARWSTAELRAKKRSYIADGRLSLWMREWEVTITGSELADFDLKRLNYWSQLDPEATFPTFMYIDPVPPPSPREETKGLGVKNFEVFAVVGVINGNFYILETVGNRGHQPDWTIAQFFRLVAEWKPLRVRIEGTGYQRTLVWLLENAMKVRRQWVPIDSPTDRRKKRHKIVQSLTSTLAQGRLFAHHSQMEFIQQLGTYPACDTDDFLDAVAGAVALATEYSSLDFSLDEPTNPHEPPAARLTYDAILDGMCGAP